MELEVRLRVDLELTALKDLARGETMEASATAVTPAAIEAAVAKAKADSAKYLAQSRIEYDTKIRQISAESEARLESLRAELDTLKAEMETMRPQLEEERASHQKTRLEKEILQKQQPLMLQEISIAQGNVEELKTELERVSGELATAEFDLTELRKLNARMAAALDEERAARTHMQESGSWQLTKPIRAVGDLFGPRKKY
jgi:chromosome segregation ATPase